MTIVGTDYLLVHGASSSPAYWSRVVPLLEQRGDRAVAVALPTADPAAGLAAYADAIVAAAPRGRPVTVVAQSMAGFSAPLSVSRLDVVRLVLLNAMVPAPAEAARDWFEAVGHAEAKAAFASAEGRDPDADFDLLVDFFHDVPDDVREELFALGEPPQEAQPFLDPWPLDRWPDVETLVLAGSEDRFLPLALQVEVARDRLGLDVTPLPGGHLTALSHPHTLTPHL